jgi:hypothetical protein
VSRVLTVPNLIYPSPAASTFQSEAVSNVLLFHTLQELRDNLGRVEHGLDVMAILQTRDQEEQSTAQIYCPSPSVSESQKTPLKFNWVGMRS